MDEMTDLSEEQNTNQDQMNIDQTAGDPFYESLEQEAAGKTELDDTDTTDTVL